MSLTSTLQAIADAIRAKTGKTTTMTPAEMPSEIAGIETGRGGVVLSSLKHFFNPGTETGISMAAIVRNRDFAWWCITKTSDDTPPGIDKDSGLPKIALISGTQYDLSYVFGGMISPTSEQGTYDVVLDIPEVTNWQYSFYNNRLARSLAIKCEGGNGSGVRAFSLMSHTETIDLDGAQFSICAHFTTGSDALRAITGLMVNTSGHAAFQNAFLGAAIEKVTFHQNQQPSKCLSPIDLSSTVLTVDGAVALFASLPDVTGQTNYSTYCIITLTGTPAAAGLTAEQLAVATAKGWTVTV